MGSDTRIDHQIAEAEMGKRLVEFVNERNPDYDILIVFKKSGHVYAADWRPSGVR